MAARVINFRTGRELERSTPAGPVPRVSTSAPAPAKRKRGAQCDEQRRSAVDARNGLGDSPNGHGPGGPPSGRKALLAKIHVAKKQLGLTEEEYRALLDGHFGAASAADLGLTDLKRLVLVLADYGFKPSKGHARRGVSRKRETPATLTNDNDKLGREPLMKKIEAQLTEKGRAEGTDVPWGYAVAILKRQSGGVTRCFEHATPEQLRGVIAALTRDARRNGRRAY